MSGPSDDYIALGLKYPEDLDYLYFTNKGGDSCRIPTDYSKLGRSILPTLCDKYGNGNKVTIDEGDTMTVTPNYFVYTYTDITKSSNNFSGSIAGSYFIDNSSELPSPNSAISQTVDQPGVEVIDVKRFNTDKFVNNCYCSTSGIIHEGGKSYGGVTTGSCAYTNGTLWDDSSSCNIANVTTKSASVPNPTPYVYIPTQEISSLVWAIVIISGVAILGGLIILSLVMFGVFSSGKTVLDDVRTDSVQHQTRSQPPNNTRKDTANSLEPGTFS